MTHADTIWPTIATVVTSARRPAPSTTHAFATALMRARRREENEDDMRAPGARIVLHLRPLVPPGVDDEGQVAVGDHRSGARRLDQDAVGIPDLAQLAHRPGQVEPVAHVGETLLAIEGVGE